MELLFVLICNLLSWAAFVLTDYIEETQNEDLFLLTFILSGVLTIAAYIWRELKTKPHRAASVLEAGGFFLKWAGISLVCSFVMLQLFERSFWPIAQSRERWFNGMEYYVFAVLYPAAIALFLLLWNFGRGIFFWRKHKKESQND